MEIDTQKTFIKNLAAERDETALELQKESHRFPFYFWLVIGACAGATSAAFYLR